MKKGQKELEELYQSIINYIAIHDGDCMVNVSVMGFEGEKCKIVNDAVWSYGVKDVILLDNEEHSEMVKKEKSDFIDWVIPE